METAELYYPQIAAQAGSYTFEHGIEIEIYSAKESYIVRSLDLSKKAHPL